MSSPSRPDAKAAAAVRSNTRGPNLDRARIDSDVRAFLRPASSPWIVFDRDSRIDDFGKAALRLGAVFASRPSFRSELHAPAHEEPRIEEARPEPSGMTVAADVLSEECPPPAAEDSLRSFTQSVDEPVVVPVRRFGRASVAGMVAGAIAVAACVGLLAKGMGPSAPSPLAEVAHAAAIAAEAPAAPAEAPPAPAEPGPAEAVAPPPAAAEATSDAAPKPAKAARGKHRFGKLTLKRAAAHKNVWFDGKRMLGSGRRSFTVFCGMHTIAVGEKANAKDVEVPCNGEYVVAR